ncbi:TPA: hypothetical protein ACPFI9_001654 [Providencia rettgeri]
MKKYFMLIFPISILFLSLTIYYKSNSKIVIPSLNCYAQVQYNYERNDGFDVMNSGIGYALENGQGLISYSARLDRNGEVFHIKRDIKVTYKVTERNSFLIDVKEIKISPTDTLPKELSYKYMYGYTREEGGWFNVNVKSNGSNSYLMYTTSIPQFFCKKL